MAQPIPFNNETKSVDAGRPMHRIQSPTFSTDKQRPSGRGYECGCRHTGMYDPLTIADNLAILGLKAGIAAIPGIGPFLTGVNAAIAGVTGTDLEEELAKLLKHAGERLIFARYLRSIPAWVPVDRKGFPQDDPNFKEVPVEIEGFLSRSFQSFRDMPHLQWSRWYKWAFHVDPATGYRHMIGSGNVATESESERLSEVDANRAELTNIDFNSSIECILDCGAFYNAPGNRSGDKLGIMPALMFHPKWPFWPVANDYFWCRGRFVYDCAHASNSKTEGPGMGLHPTTINPISMFAFSRREGFKFEDNHFHTPSIRFQFFACKKGGYIDAEKLGGGDAKDDPIFIVDLPDGGGIEEMSWAIQHSEIVAGNTLVVRPRLLKHLQIFPYDIPGSEFPSAFKTKPIEPVIEILQPKDLKLLPQQVKITVPLSKLDASADACGFVLTLGWLDLDDSQADRVKKVSFRYVEMHELEVSGNLRFRLAINGRHQFFHVNDSKKSHNLNIPETVMHLIDDQSIDLDVHAFRRRGYGEYFEKTDKERTLRIGGLIDPGPTAEKVIKDGIEFIKLANGEFIRSDLLKELLKSGIDEIVGARRDVVWLDHVDQKNNTIASAVSREMFLDPPAIFVNQDEPAGFVDDPGPFNFQCSNISPDVDLRMSNLVTKLNGGQKQFNYAMEARQLFVLGDDDLIAVKINKGIIFFKMTGSLSIDHQT